MEKIPNLFDLLTGTRDDIAEAIRRYARAAGIPEEEAQGLATETADKVHGNREEMKTRLRAVLSAVTGVAGEKLGFVTRPEFEAVLAELHKVREELAVLKDRIPRRTKKRPPPGDE